jgi:hypothetical protein
LSVEEGERSGEEGEREKKRRKRSILSLVVKRFVGVDERRCPTPYDLNSTFRRRR